MLSNLKFQSPRSGKFESNLSIATYKDENKLVLFQSPRSGKFESNTAEIFFAEKKINESFNPLDRGNLNQIPCREGEVGKEGVFQSPRSGKFESNL